MSTDYSREEHSFPSRARHTRCFTGHETGFKMPSSSRISGSPALDTDWLPSEPPVLMSVASCTDADDQGWTCPAWAQGSWLIGWRHDCDKCIIKQKLCTTVTETTPNNCHITSRMVSTCFMLLIYPVFRQQQTLSANISIILYIVSWGISVMTFSFFTGTFLTIRGINQDKPT